MNKIDRINCAKNTLNILVALGCGAFRNSPFLVANCFKYHLLNEKTFKNIFEKIIFAIYDTTHNKGNYNTFNSVLY